MEVTIRPYSKDDAATLCRLLFASVRQAAQRDYTAEQVKAWAPKEPDPVRFHARASDGRTVLVAINHRNEPIAYGDFEADGHIDHLLPP